MDIERTNLPDVLLLRPSKHGDHRGFLSEVFRDDLLKAAGIDFCWMQDNHSYSAQSGVVRGLHFQAPPAAQAKIVRVVRGAVLDVALDIRRSSPTYGQHVAIELSAENWTQIFLPPGFAHGFCTLTPDVEIIYKASMVYAPESEGGVLWNDPELGIDWPFEATAAVVADRDLKWPTLRDLASPF